MLRSRRLRGNATTQTLAIVLAGVLMVSFGGCSGDRSPDQATRADDIVVRPAGEPRGIEDPLGSFREWLSNARRGAAAAPGGVGWNDGYIPDRDSLSPFETDHPAIANLEPALLEAVQRAALDALENGVELRISSGWRSAGYQEVLLDQAILSYGSEETARRFVKTPEQSTHVTGEAVDISPTDAMSWLSQHGSAYGLCQTYANEMWHYELMIEPGGVCQPPLMDASVSHEPDGRQDAGQRSRPRLEPDSARP